MAALATAAISRVGTETSGAQAQVTITMTATVRATSAPSSAAEAPSATAPTAESAIQLPASTETASRVETTQAGRSATVSRTVAPPVAIAPTTSTTTPAAWVPNLGSLPQLSMTPVPAATTTKPTATKSTKTPTPTASSSSTVAPNGTVREWTWTRRQGTIHAACRGDRLVYAETWAANGYRVVKSSTWFRTAVVFKGPSPVTVLVGCHDWRATFTTAD